VNKVGAPVKFRILPKGTPAIPGRGLGIELPAIFWLPRAVPLSAALSRSRLPPTRKS
jgi:hypothetical protein